MTSEHAQLWPGKLQPRVNAPQDRLKMLPTMSSQLKLKSAVKTGWTGMDAAKGEGSLHLN